MKKRGPSAVITSVAKRPRVESSEETSQSRSIFQYLESWIFLFRAKGCVFSLPAAVYFANLPEITRQGNKLVPLHSQVPVVSRQWFCALFFLSPLLDGAQNLFLVWNEMLTWSFPSIKETSSTVGCPYRCCRGISSTWKCYQCDICDTEMPQVAESTEKERFLQLWERMKQWWPWQGTCLHLQHKILAVSSSGVLFSLMLSIY